MIITKVNCPENKYDIKCPYTMNPQFLIVHNTANDASAMAEISYMLGNNNTVSYHYAVDDKSIVQGIDENRNTWNCGDGTNGNGNRNGISMEICYSKSGGDRFAKAEDNAVELIVDILKRYGWGIEQVKKHQDFNGKYCPHRTLDLGWDRFLDKIRNKIGGAITKTEVTSVNRHVRVTAAVGLNARSGPGINYDKVFAYPYNAELTIIEEKGNWGKTSNGNWVCLDYISDFSAASKKYALGRYKVNASAGLNVRSGPGTNYKKIKAYANGTIFDTYQISNDWAKTPSGWVCLDYTTLLYTY